MKKLVLKLTGSHREALDRLFDTLSSALAKVTDDLACGTTSSDGGSESMVVEDLSEVAKAWLGAKLERPTLENEKRAAEIVETYERIKTAQLERQLLEIEKQAKMLELENATLSLNERRIASGLKWLGCLKSVLTEDDDGNLTLLLSDDHSKSASDGELAHATSSSDLSSNI